MLIDDDGKYDDTTFLMAATEFDNDFKRLVIDLRSPSKLSSGYLQDNCVIAF